MMKNSAFEWLGCGFSALLTVAQTNAMFQIISLILTCLATLLTIAFTIYKWYKKAKEDGKIDEKEVGELIDLLKEETEKLNNIVSTDNVEDKGDK